MAGTRGALFFAVLLLLGVCQAARLQADRSSGTRRKLLAVNTYVSVKNVCKYAVDIAVVANPQYSGGVPQYATPGAPKDQPSFKNAHLEPGAETAVDFAVIDTGSYTGVSVLAMASPTDNGLTECMIWAADKTALLETDCNRAGFTYGLDASRLDLWTSYMVSGDTACGCYFWSRWDFTEPFTNKESLYVTLDCDGLSPSSSGGYDGFLDGQAGSSSSATSPASTTIVHVRNDNTYPVTVVVATGPTWSALDSDACMAKQETLPVGCMLSLEPGQDSGPAIALVDTALVSLVAAGWTDSSSAKVWGQATDLADASAIYRCGVNFIPDTGNHEPYIYLTLDGTMLGCYQYFTVSAVLRAQPGLNRTTLMSMQSLRS
ncbi:hypothetical protein ACK3TF_003017 [Chlorella vulgaris]